MEHFNKIIEKYKPQFDKKINHGNNEKVDTLRTRKVFFQEKFLPCRLIDLGNRLH